MLERVRLSNRVLLLGLELSVSSLAGCGGGGHPGIPHPSLDAGDVSGHGADAGPITAGTGAAGTAAPSDAGVPDAQVAEDDAGPPACDDRACAQMANACASAACNHKTETCEMHAHTDGTACGDALDDRCTDPDTCLAGQCIPNHQAMGTACADQGVACHNVDECDGQGHCVDHGLLAEGTACGDSTSNACDGPDTCNAAGQCLPHYAPADSACGDQALACHNNDSCDGHGNCIDHGVLAAGSSCSMRNLPIGACHLAADVCDARGQCVLGDAPDGTPCGSSAHSECDGADSCTAGICASNLASAGSSCGSPSESACDHADQCDGAGMCLTRREFVGAPCGTQSQSCLLADACDSNAQCVSGGPAALNTPCGSPTQDTCTAPDSCDGAGACRPNHAAVNTACSFQSRDCRDADRCDGSGACQPGVAFAPGTACGDPSNTECDHPDSCSAGSCQSNFAAEGSACGDQGVACQNNDACDTTGHCADHGPMLPCNATITGTVKSGAGAPLAGITVEDKGSGQSTQTNASGVFSLSVPFNMPVRLHYHETAGYWGQILTHTFSPTNVKADASLSSDANISSLIGMVSGLPALQATQGLVRVNFLGDAVAGGETASVSPGAAPAFTQGSSGFTVSPTLQNGGGTYLVFINAPPGNTMVSAQGVDGVDTCVAPSSPLPVLAHTITDVPVDCTGP
jgi:hypothetical protein